MLVLAALGTLWLGLAAASESTLTLSPTTTCAWDPVTATLEGLCNPAWNASNSTAAVGDDGSSSDIANATLPTANATLWLDIVDVTTGAWMQ